jgi:hypothetical protein
LPDQAIAVFWNYSSQAKLTRGENMANKKVGKPQITPNEPEHINSRRDPEERPVESEVEAREKSMDKTLADSFPTSDPPSTIPDPSGDDSLSENSRELMEETLEGLPEGSWAALSIGDRTVIGTGATREEATEAARQAGYTEMSLVRVDVDAEDADQVMGRAS